MDSPASAAAAVDISLNERTSSSLLLASSFYLLPSWIEM